MELKHIWPCLLKKDIKVAKKFRFGLAGFFQLSHSGAGDRATEPRESLSFTYSVQSAQTPCCLKIMCRPLPKTSSL